MIDIHDLLLAVHVIAGTLGLVLGPVALLFRSRRRGRSLALGYHWAVLAVAMTAIGLVAIDPGALWWLVPLALFSYACVLAGLHAAPERVRVRLHGLGGSYIALLTALLVVSIDGPAAIAAWTLPTVIGVILIERTVGRTARNEVIRPIVAVSPISR